MYRNRPTQVNKMKNNESNEPVADEIKRRFAKNFLDMLILQLVEAEPTWGYDIIKKTENQYKTKLRHGALYPMLNTLEKKGFITSRKELEKGRIRKIYEITPEGQKLLEAYRSFLAEQTVKKNVKTE